MTVHPSASIHSHAIVDAGARVGARTRIWAFAHILPNASIGEDCNICDQTFVEGNVRIGDRVTVKCGVHLWDGVTVEDDVFIGPSAVFTNDMRPRSKQYPEAWARTVLRRGSSIGANATILPVTIGSWAMVAAGAVVTRDVPAHALVVGAPAVRRGWVCRCGTTLGAFVELRARCGCGREFVMQEDGVHEETERSADGA